MEFNYNFTYILLSATVEDDVCHKNEKVILGKLGQ
jgi:hypothetical protein